MLQPAARAPCLHHAVGLYFLHSGHMSSVVGSSPEGETAQQMAQGFDRGNLSALLCQAEEKGVGKKAPYGLQAEAGTRRKQIREAKGINVKLTRHDTAEL